MCLEDESYGLSSFVMLRTYKPFAYRNQAYGGHTCPAGLHSVIELIVFVPSLSQSIQCV
jgi:hypothetical protein